MSFSLQGIFPAVITPFTPQGEVDEAALERLIAKLYAAEVDGLYVCGQTGEGLLQSVAMRMRALETAVRCSPAGKLVIAHVGAARQQDALALAEHAGRAGAGAVSSLPPQGQFAFSEIRCYYAALASNSPLPVVVYYYPEASPGLTGAHVLDLCGLPNVVGVKFTSFELHHIPALSRAGATVLNGRDEVLAPGLLMGASGGIGSFYNLTPELFVRLYRAARGENWTEARRIQDRLNQLMSITLQFPMIPAIKKMLGWSGISCGEALPPRRRLNAAEEMALRASLEAAEFDPGGFLSGNGQP